MKRGCNCSTPAWTFRAASTASRAYAHVTAAPPVALAACRRMQPVCAASTRQTGSQGARNVLKQMRRQNLCVYPPERHARFALLVPPHEALCPPIRLMY
eukprot:6183833-Pleurochrysis_carterae.AAC.1